MWTRDAYTAKFWLAPVELAYNTGFRPKELRDIRRMVMEDAAEFLEAWHDNFPPRSRVNAWPTYALTTIP